MRSSILLGTLAFTVACATATDSPEDEGSGGTTIGATGGETGTGTGGVFGATGGLGGAGTGGAIAATGGATSTGGVAATGGGTSTGGTSDPGCDCSRMWVTEQQFTPPFVAGECLGYMGTLYMYQPDNATSMLDYGHPTCLPGTAENASDNCRYHAKVVEQGPCP